MRTFDLILRCCNADLPPTKIPGNNGTPINPFILWNALCFWRDKTTGIVYRSTLGAKTTGNVYRTNYSDSATWPGTIAHTFSTAANDTITGTFLYTMDDGSWIYQLKETVKSGSVTTTNYYRAVVDSSYNIVSKALTGTYNSSTKKYSGYVVTSGIVNMGTVSELTSPVTSTGSFVINNTGYDISLAGIGSIHLRYPNNPLIVSSATINGKTTTYSSSATDANCPFEGSGLGEGRIHLLGRSLTQTELNSRVAVFDATGKPS